MTTEQLDKNLSPTTPNPEAQELSGRERWVTPLVDIFENDQEVLLVAEVPGVKPGDVDIQFNRGELTLLARASAAVQGDLERAEFEPVGYRRTFAVRRGIDEGQIKATLQHGLLTVHLPRSEAHRPRQIPVRSV